MRRASVRAEAADLLACLASQPRLPDDIEIAAWRYTTYDLPGRWSQDARSLATSTVEPVIGGHGYWREMYAEAEAQLRGAP